MNNLERYLDQVIEQKPVAYDLPSEPERQVQPGIGRALRRRWYIALLAFVAVCALALPGVWLLVKPKYVATGAVHVAPVVPNILTGEAEKGEILDYDSYMNTQAVTILSPRALQNVADELQKQGVSLFQGDSLDFLTKFRWRLKLGSSRPEMVEVLKLAVAEGVISAAAVRRTEMISVTVKSSNANEAKVIADLFLQNFRDLHDKDSSQASNTTLDRLENEATVVSRRVRELESEINALSQKVGTTAMDSRQSMEMQRQTALSTELARVQARRIGLDASIAALEQGGDSNSPPEQLMAARKEYINADPMIQSLTGSIMEMRRDMTIARQSLVPGNPELDRKQQLLDTFEQDLKAKEKELAEEFEAQVDERRAVVHQQRLISLKVERDQLVEYEKKLAEAVGTQEVVTLQLGQVSADREGKEFELSRNRELYDQIMRRKRDLEMERERTPRVEIQYLADIGEIEDKRIKYSLAFVFLAAGCGVGLAVIRDRMDKTLQTLDDLSREIDLPVIGTTTSSRTVKPAAFAEHLAGDYQTIRTNLSLLTSGGMPKKLAVSSPGMREGKTTFAVNLATSLAKAGKKVLLIDGDLRKPDIASMLSILNGSAGLQEVLLGGDFSKAIHVVSASGLHVLVASSRSSIDAYELLTSVTAAEQIEKLAHQYDHLIVDTPPALVFPDALVWAKLTDAVVLVSYAGQTMVPDLKEAKDRFTRIRARVLGAVLSNVPADRSLNRSPYSYRPAGPQARYRARMARKLLLLTHSPEVDARSVKDAGNEME